MREKRIIVVITQVVSAVSTIIPKYNVFAVLLYSRKHSQTLNTFQVVQVHPIVKATFSGNTGIQEWEWCSEIGNLSSANTIGAHFLDSIRISA